MSTSSKPKTGPTKLDLSNADGALLSAGPYSAAPLSATSKASALFQAKLSARIGNTPLLPRTPLDPDPLTGRLNIVEAPLTPPALTPTLPSVSPPSSADDELDNAESAVKSSKGLKSAGLHKRDLKDTLSLLRLASDLPSKPRSQPASPFFLVSALPDDDGSGLVGEVPLFAPRRAGSRDAAKGIGAGRTTVYPLSVNRTARRRALLDDDEAYLSDPGPVVSPELKKKVYHPAQRGKQPFPVRSILPLSLGQNISSENTLDERRQPRKKQPVSELTKS